MYFILDIVMLCILINFYSNTVLLPLTLAKKFFLVPNRNAMFHVLKNMTFYEE